MDSDLFLDGKSLISASRASKETGYAQDYIGQLCRLGKVPSKMVGRTWFVSLESLVEYQKGNPYKNKSKLEIRTVSAGDLGIPRLNSAKSTFKYESVSAPLLPPVKKFLAAGEEKVILQSKKRSRATPYFVSGMSLASVLVVAIFWFRFVPPEGLRNFRAQVAGIREDFHFALVGESSSSTEPGTTTASDGIVIFPDSADHDEKVASIKNNFSDEVGIVFDEGGESGVIQPIFRKGSDTEDYAFVMVPIKPKK